MTYSFRDGYASVQLLEGGDEFRIPLADYERVRAEWMGGETFIRLDTVHGGEVDVKGSRIEAVAKMTAEALAESHRLAAEEKADDMLRGD